ncbi:MAG: hypothetical protein OXE99_11165 [Cellvibrionales bacterium]|nr:hypothetical protein [Cellvibrionales bacterium]
MIGPLEYFGTLTRADKYAYQISIGDLYPIIYRYPRHEAKETKRPPVDPKVITQVDAKWLSGLDKNLASTLAKYPKPEKAPSSLVQASGIFEMNLKEINLQAFDATAVDLTPFGASLVQNDQPFIMLNQKEDPLEAVTYLFGEKYAKAQIEKPVGLFLETHGFSQTITPLLKGCAGYVVLARRHGNTTMYDLIAVQIPFGFTLVVFKGAIHGDTTLKGKYLMCMTANHKTMATADVVFLKNRNTHDNVSINLVGEDDQSVSDPLTFSQESVYFNNSHQGIKQGFYDKVNGDAKMRRGLLPFSRFILVDKASVKIITECLLHRAKKAIKG